MYGTEDNGVLSEISVGVAVSVGKGVGETVTGVKVANGNGVNGMARKVAHYLSELGYKTARIFNLRPFNKAVTQIEYRKGYEAEALKLGSLLPVKVAYSESNQIHGDVRLVLGHDIKQNMAAWTPWLNKVRVAQSDAASRL